MPEFHAEPYVYLAGLTHKSALIAWGAFYFKTRSNGRAKLVDDEDLQWVHPPRCDSIGCTSRPYGPAQVDVYDESGAAVASAMTNDCNHCAISGLQADTRYRYTVRVKHEVWGEGNRWDWDPAAQGLVQAGGAYRHEFRTLPHPLQPLDRPLSFIVIGDFGMGVRTGSGGGSRSATIRPSARGRSTETRTAWRRWCGCSKPPACAPASAATSTTSSTRAGMESTTS